ncbi:MULTISPECIES: hypothetical protein [unclassified Rhodococcus (in: high G+C Gram-positive bacteria)]
MYMRAHGDPTRPEVRQEVASAIGLTANEDMPWVTPGNFDVRRVGMTK